MCVAGSATCVPAYFVSNFARLQSYSVLAREQLRKREHPAFDDVISYMVWRVKRYNCCSLRQAEAYRVIYVFLLAKNLFNAETLRRRARPGKVNRTLFARVQVGLEVVRLRGATS